MKTDFTETEEKIRELVPRLKELSFGCEYFFEGMTRKVVKNDGVEIADDFGESFLFGSYPGCFKRIGHPIRLEDVLKAILANDTNIGLTDMTTITMWLVKNWEYGKDFSQQSEEIKLFIKELLK